MAQRYQHMNAQTQEHRDHSFVIGLLTGTVIGAGLAMWFAPRSASELRKRVTDSARNLGERVSEQYEQASTRVGEAVDELTRKGQDVRDDVADAVARGAHEVERYATAARTDRVAEVRKHSAADRSAARRHSL
jgi:gas vesicle protein